MDGDIYVNNLANKSLSRGVYSTKISSDISYFLNTKPQYAAYFAEDFSGNIYISGNTIPNYIKNGWDATIFQYYYGLSATTVITYITGTPTSTITFGTGTIPSTFTILSFTRHNGGSRFRILT